MPHHRRHHLAPQHLPDDVGSNDRSNSSSNSEQLQQEETCDRHFIVATRPRQHHHHHQRFLFVKPICTRHFRLFGLQYVYCEQIILIFLVAVLAFLLVGYFASNHPST
jgi:hypothetical protein